MNRPDLPENARVHMLGIGGVGVSGLAIVMSKMGYTVTGSDQNPGATAGKLEALGITVYTGHKAENVSDADLVVASAAVPKDNPEIALASERGIPILSRAQMLGRLMSGNYGIAVSGTHGKTTTTSMLAILLESAGLDPTILIGGDLGLLNGNAKLGSNDLFLTEACEAFGSFLELRPRMAVITNIEGDHLDYYGNLDGVKNGFRQFLSQIEDGGVAIVCADCANVRDVIPSIKSRVVTYGLNDGLDCRAYDVNADIPNPTFSATLRGVDLGQFTLSVPGMHNVRNALAIIAAGSELGIDMGIIRDALSAFHGAGRRFEVLGTANGITVIDDYAHHPTEVQATLAAARTWGRRVVAVFQPHLFSRTKLFAEEFANSLKAADVIVLSEVYPAREKPMPGVSASMISDRINADGCHDAKFMPDKRLLASALLPMLKSGDLVVVMGAGDIRAAAEELLERLQASESAMQDK